MANNPEEMRVHSLNFSEKEYHELTKLMKVEVEFYNNSKELYPEVWKFLNRMSYVVAHGTEDGWSDGS